MNARSYIGLRLRVKIDRPLGSRHPNFGTVYPVNYGFLPGTQSGDGEELDAYVLGESRALEEAEGLCIAVLHRLDDDDDKLILSCDGRVPTEAQIREQLDFQERFFSSELYFD